MNAGKTKMKSHKECLKKGISWMHQFEQNCMSFNFGAVSARFILVKKASKTLNLKLNLDSFVGFGFNVHVRLSYGYYVLFRW